MSKEKSKAATVLTAVDDPTQPVPSDKRQHWLTPAVIFGALEFSIPVLMVGTILAASFGLGTIVLILFVAFFGIQWAGNALNGYIGAKMGRPSSIIARSSFGTTQSKYIIALVILIACVGWFAVQTSVTANAIAAMFGIDHTDPANWGIWALITIVLGLIFALPSIIGYNSMKWTDYLTVPVGLIICGVGIYLGVSHAGGLTQIFQHVPAERQITFIAAINIIIGLNISQWIIAADYTRYARPRILDNILIPLGIIAIGIPLIFVGAVMSIGQGTADIVLVMVNLGFPFWAFILLFILAWTSQLVNSYSTGLAFCNLLSVTSNKGRMVLTFIGAILGIIAALSGILDFFIPFLLLTSLLYSPMAGIIFCDYFMRKGNWEDNKGWNFVATIALVCGIAVGYTATFIAPFGIPILKSAAVSALLYFILTKAKGKFAPDHFTPKAV